MRSDCKRIRRWMNDWIDGRLSKPRCLEVRAHMGECSACEVHGREMVSLVRVLQGAPAVPAPREILPGVVRRLMVERSTSGRPPGAPPVEIRLARNPKTQAPPASARSGRIPRRPTRVELRPVAPDRNPEPEEERSVMLSLPARIAMAFAAAGVVVAATLLFTGDGGTYGSDPSGRDGAPVAPVAETAPGETGSPSWDSPEASRAIPPATHFVATEAPTEDAASGLEPKEATGSTPIADPARQGGVKVNH